MQSVKRLMRHVPAWLASLLLLALLLCFVTIFQAKSISLLESISITVATTFYTSECLLDNRAYCK